MATKFPEKVLGELPLGEQQALIKLKDFYAKKVVNITKVFDLENVIKITFKRSNFSLIVAC